MQRAKARAPFCVVVVASVVEDATFATPADPPPPQPAASSEDATTAATEAKIRGQRQRGSIARTVESRSIRRVALRRCLSAAARR
jgi:hypothetical protein